MHKTETLNSVVALICIQHVTVAVPVYLWATLSVKDTAVLCQATGNQLELASILEDKVNEFSKWPRGLKKHLSGQLFTV